MSLAQFYPLESHPKTGEPFIRLPSPHGRIIITPPRLNDVADIVDIINHPAVRQWLDGPPFPYLASHAEEWVVRLKHESDAVLHVLRQAAEVYPDGPLVTVSASPVSCLREVQDDGREDFLGAMTFNRCEYADVQDPDEARLRVWQNAQKPVGDPGIEWCSGYYVKPTYHGRGIVTTALRTMMEAWVVPRMEARLLRVETIIGNAGCLRVLEKNGFVLTDAIHTNKRTTGGMDIDGYYVLSRAL